MGGERTPPARPQASTQHRQQLDAVHLERARVARQHHLQRRPQARHQAVRGGSAELARNGCGALAIGREAAHACGIELGGHGSRQLARFQRLHQRRAAVHDDGQPLQHGRRKVGLNHAQLGVPQCPQRVNIQRGGARVTGSVGSGRAGVQRHGSARVGGRRRVGPHGQPRGTRAKRGLKHDLARAPQAQRKAGEVTGHDEKGGAHPVHKEDAGLLARHGDALDAAARARCGAEHAQRQCGQRVAALGARKHTLHRVGVVRVGGERKPLELLPRCGCTQPVLRGARRALHGFEQRRQKRALVRAARAAPRPPPQRQQHHLGSQDAQATAQAFPATRWECVEPRNGRREPATSTPHHPTRHCGTGDRQRPPRNFLPV